MLAQSLLVSALVATSFASSDAAGHGSKRSRAHHKAAAAKRDNVGATNARMTFYDTSVGLGACGVWHANSEYTVALNSAQLALYGSSYPSPACGKTITISYGGKTTQATIQDECPTCPWGGLDLSEDLFSFFADQDVGVLSASWWYGGSSDSEDDDTTTTTKAATSTKAAATTTWTPETTSTSSSEYVAPTTTSTSEWVAATTSTSEWVAPSSSSSSKAAATTSAVNVQNNVEAESSSSSSSAEWVAATTSSTAEWKAATTSSKAWAAPTKTKWHNAAASASAAVEDTVFSANGSMCSSPESVLLFTNTTLLYNGTTLDLLLSMTNSSSNVTSPFLFGANSTLSAFSFNGTQAFNDEDDSTVFHNATNLVMNATSILDEIVGYCFNSTLFPLVFSPNGTFANGTAPDGSALNGTSSFSDFLFAIGAANVTSAFNTTGVY